MKFTYLLVNFLSAIVPLIFSFHPKIKFNNYFGPFLKANVMCFMCSSYGSEIIIIGLPKNFKALVNEYIMYNEISKAINSDASTDPEPIIEIIFHSKKQSCNSRQGKNQKEIIVMLKESFAFFFMMITM